MVGISRSGVGGRRRHPPEQCKICEKKWASVSTLNFGTISLTQNSEDSINHGQVGDDGNAPFMYMELRSGSFISLIIVLLVWVFLSIWVSH
jgi:hypothetical protein